jgi:glycosyltransferase domain-containing protein
MKPTNSIETSFRDGNYTQVAMTGTPDQWQTYAALGLFGKTPEAIAGLSQFHHDEARFYTAVASWIGGDEQTAIRILGTIFTPHARKLLALLRKPSIQVLAQLPWNLQASITNGMTADNKFEVKFVDFAKPYANIHHSYEVHNPPDFYLCQMVEWHFIPPNLQELACPLFGQTAADSDVHIQAVYPWYQLFDELLASDQEDWENMRQLVPPVPVSTFPKIFAIAVYQESPLSRVPKTIDVLQTGTVLHPYHPEKAELMLEILLRDSRIKFYVIDQFLSRSYYEKLLAHSKICYNYIRVPTAIPTRALEALNAECATVIQKGSVLTLWVGEEEGVLTYDYEAGANNLVSQIQHILKHWSEFEVRARKGAAVIRREFEYSKVASQYLRFLTFLAAKPRPPRQFQPTAQLLQKRNILEKGWLPVFGDHPILAELAQTTVNRLLKRWQQREEISARVSVDIVREIVLFHVGAKDKNKSWVLESLQLYREGLAQFPHSLVLRFNFIRVALYFGTSQAEVSEALELATATLALPEEIWQIEVLEDVFPWDFFSNFFNYRQYFSLVVEHLKKHQGNPGGIGLTRLILASLAYHVGHYDGNPNSAYFKRAVALDPEFPFYKFAYAKNLIKQGQLAPAIDLLIRLVEHSMLFGEALSLLQELQNQQLCHHPKVDQLTTLFKQVRPRLTIETILASFSFLKFAVEQEIFSLPLSRAQLEISSPTVPTSKQTLISILIPTKNRSVFLTRALRYYDTVGFQGALYIGDSSDSPHREDNQRLIKEYEPRLNLVYCYLPSPPYQHEGMAVSELSKLTTTPYIVQAGDDDFLIPASLEKCVAFLETHPSYVAAHGLRVCVYQEAKQPYGKLTAVHDNHQPILELETAVERWTSYMRDGYSTQFSVHRVATWRRMHRDATAVATRYFGTELLPCSISCIAGKIGQVECLSVVMQAVNEGTIWDKTNVYELITQPDWPTSVDTMRRSIVEALVETNGISMPEAQTIFDRELWLHLQWFLTWQFQKKYAGQKPPETSDNLLASFLDPAHSFYADFMPVYQAMTIPPFLGRA